MSQDNLIKVLDHGFVRLVDSMGSDKAVVQSARVSYNAEWRTGEDTGSDKRLINYLWKNKHTSPFESVTFTFEVKAPIFVFRQWHRHRTWSFNEVSARYTELPEEYYLPKPELVGEQSKINKQGRTLSQERIFLNNRKQEVDWIKTHSIGAFETYNDLLKEGWPRELARMVLPLSTYSHMFATVNLLNLFKFITLRSDEHAQYEIRVFSDAMKELIRPIVPVCVEAFENGIKT